MKEQAIAVCRVSTAEQKQNGSLSRQELNVRKSAEELGVEIVAWWSGDVSSKAGTNVKRKDLKQMEEYCKKNKRVKYLIVDEPDRFMRSIDEASYFEVLFSLLGVKVWYASDPNLNKGDLLSKMLKFAKYFPAEGSNLERQTKSIEGHKTAISQGRYTFHPKPGYVKGEVPGIHLPHPKTFEPLKQAYEDIISNVYTPLQALKRLNESAFTDVHSPWKMDKLRRFATDPYYAGILIMDKQVKARNINGKHIAMISLEDHEELARIFNATMIKRGQKKHYNPEFPMNKILLCEDCGNEQKFTGSIKNNGLQRKNTTYYSKYHCKSCGRGYHKSEVHQAITDRLEQITYNDQQRSEFIEALCIVWEKKQHDRIAFLQSLEKQLDKMKETKSKLVVAYAHADEDMKPDIKEELEKVKKELEATQQDVSENMELAEDLIDFLKFSLEYTNNLSQDWWELDHEERVQCQQLILPGGISFNSDKIVGTTRISPIYSFEPNKKALREDRKALMVELVGTAPTSVSSSLLVLLQAYSI